MKYKYFDKSAAIYSFYTNYANIIAPLLVEEENFRKKQLFLLFYQRYVVKFI